MSIENKLMNIITAHPKLVIFGIGLAITLTIATAVGLRFPEQVLAPGGVCTHCHNNS